MVFGHNTNIKLGNSTFHVQTEDRGEPHALIDTTVYYQGRVLHRRTNNYFDLLPMNDDRRQALKLRVDEQHQTVLEEMHSGLLQLAIPQPTNPPPPPAPVPVTSASAEIPAADADTATVAEVPALPRKLKIELMNPQTWLAGKRATLRLSVKEENGDPVPSARIDVHIEGSAVHRTFSAECGIHGQAQLEFEMPKIASAEAAMVIQAAGSLEQGQLRFALRAKPKVPAG